LRLDGCQIKKVGMDDFAQFWVRYSSGFSIDDQDLFHVGMVQALEQDAFSHHARCSGDNGFNFHELEACR